MKLKFAIYLFLFLAFAPGASAQQGSGEEKANVNKTDAKGKPHGWWLNQQPPRMGEVGYSEFGIYNHGRKAGLWYKMDSEGSLLSIETYRNNTLDGEVKYFENGKLVRVGHYRGLNPDRPTDTVIVENPITGQQTLRPVSTDRGSLRHGMWRYYDPETGRLVREEDYQVDELVYKKAFNLSHEDSIYYHHRMSQMPHSKKVKPKLPSGKKKTSYISY